MKWSLKIARVAGIDIRIHATFLLLLLWVAYVAYAAQRTAQAAIAGVIFILAVFVTIVMHELGHSLTAKRFGVQTREITLLPIGGVSQLERIPDDPKQELGIAAAGPAVSLAIAAVLYGVLRIGDFAAPDWPSFDTGSFLWRLMWVNVALAGFNLLPAFPMDGGRVLRAALATRMPHARATHIAARMGQGLALIFGFIGLFWNPLLLFIALFVWMGATQEGAASELRSSLAEISARAAMVTDFRTLEPADTLARATELILAGAQEDFPVLDGGRLVGILTRQGLLQSLAKNGSSMLVGAAMEREYLTADPQDRLSDVLSKLGERECRTVPVVRDDQVVGLITPENVGDFIAIQSATARAQPAQPRERPAT